MAVKSKRVQRTKTINTDLDKAQEMMERDKLNRLVFKETVGGKQYTLVEIERKVGPLIASDNNNNLC